MSGAKTGPPAEVQIDVPLLRRGLHRIDPALNDLELRYLDTGWDNVVYRLGHQLLVRAPRHIQAEVLARRELRWLPELARQSTVAIPTPLYHCEPDENYPFTLSICRYLPGTSAVREERAARDGYAQDFARYLQGLHIPAPAPAPRSAFRGVPLPELDASTGAYLADLEPQQRNCAGLIWDRALAASRYTGVPRWLHGDPHPHNTIVTPVAGDPLRLAGLVDFGDLCAGDPASDWGMCWLHFSPTVRDTLLDAAGMAPGSDPWARARGWALRYALLLGQLDSTDPLGRLGQDTLRMLLDAAN